MRRFRGFTLIELLVVIAIIAVLAAILFPVFAKAQESAETASCTSNVKQMLLAITGYCTDWDNRMPDSDPLFYRTDGGPKTGTDISWAGVIQPYVGNWQVFICPGRPEHQDNWPVQGDPGYPGPGASGGLGYGYNGSYWDGLKGTPGESSPDGLSGLDGYVKVTRIRQPSETLCIADSGVNGRYQLGDAQPGNTQPWSQDEAANPQAWADGVEIGVDYYPEGRHKQGFVGGYCDGHAKFKRFGELIDEWWVWTIEKDGP